MLDAAFIGSGHGDWPKVLEKLVALGIVPKAVVQEVLVLWWFGRLIANNDMHLGNLSFQFAQHEGQELSLRLSPAYDMLPMLYAPLSGGELPLRQFTVALPLPQQVTAWQIAYEAALCFWQLVSEHDGISLSFREIGQINLQQLIQIPAVNKAKGPA